MKTAIFEKYCDFLNSFSGKTRFQVHLQTRRLSDSGAFLHITAPEGASQQLSECVEEYNGILDERVSGSSSFVQIKYLTVSVEADNHDEAYRKLLQIDSGTVSLMRRIGCVTHMLDMAQRLTLLREIYKPDDTTKISYEESARTGIYDKDLVAPYYIDYTHDNYLKLGDCYTQVLFLSDLPRDLSDSALRELTEGLEHNLFITINVEPRNPREALKEVNRRLVALNTEKQTDASWQTNHGVVLPEPPRDLKKAIEATEKFLQELETMNEKMFLCNVLVCVQGKTLEEVHVVADQVMSKAESSGCTLTPFTYDEENALNSLVPLGRNDTFVKRTFSTSSLAAFMPFHVVEINHPGGFCYGKNKLSHNIILMNRSLFQNANGFYFGCSGSGKSLAAKLELWEAFFRTQDDLTVIDLEGEFNKIVELLGGQVIEVSPDSDTRMNPFDINLYYGGEETNPVPFKSEFIISLIEVTLGYHNGIDPVTRSIIDRCVRLVYKKYLEDPREENVPTFMDFYMTLKDQPEDEAKILAISLEIYVTGSLNIFSGKSNVNVNNRLISFNTKHLGKQLYSMAMAIIQDWCWNRISRNQELNRNTWLWNDEIHYSLRYDSTAGWLINSWKRGRHYGLVATGMTQEVRDVCRNEENKALIANSEFVMLFRQKTDMIGDIANVMNLSEQQVNTLLSCPIGTGLFKAGNNMVEFDNAFPKEAKLFQYIKTDVGRANHKGEAG